MTAVDENLSRFEVVVDGSLVEDSLVVDSSGAEAALTHSNQTSPEGSHSMVFQTSIIHPRLIAALLLLLGEASEANSESALFENRISSHTFLGATQVTLELKLEGEDPENGKLAWNVEPVPFNEFGDPISVEQVLQPFTIQLKRLKLNDPHTSKRRLYAVQFPQDKAFLLGKSALHLVLPSKLRHNERPPRLLSLNENGKVVQTLDLEREVSGVNMIMTDADGRKFIAVRPNAVPAEAKAILHDADEIELLSLYQPLIGAEEVAPVTMRSDDFHTCKVLGKRVLCNKKVGRQLIEDFEKGVAEHQGEELFCFNPRHGLRVKRQGKTVDFVICFECAHVLVYLDGGKERSCATTSSARDLFNKLLKEGGVEPP